MQYGTTVNNARATSTPDSTSGSVLSAPPAPPRPQRDIKTDHCKAKQSSHHLSGSQTHWQPGNVTDTPELAQVQEDPQKLSGEQRRSNKIHCTKWSKQIKDYIESKGPDGMELVNAMLWAVSRGRNTKVTDTMVEHKY